VSGVTGGLAFNYEDLRYIELKEPGSKFPARRWGGYSQDYADTEGVLEHVDETKHYGNVLGSNEFDDTRLGAVIGSNHYGDHYIKKWGAYAGEAVDRGEEKGAGLSYGGFGDDVLRHMREHDTLQAAMRFGRDGNGAVVYIHTDTLPEWVPIAGEGRVLQTWSEGRRQVVEALADLGEATTADVVDHPAVDVGRRQVLNHLKALREDHGILDRWQDDDDGRRVVWRDDGLHRLGEHGDVDLEPVDLDDLDGGEVDELARSVHYTWYFREIPAGGLVGRESRERPR
jgi:DNA-binding transcriptional ArsR family regulator